MANEYLVNSADLTSVADAIRTKGETSAQLVFPSGFVTAIENIQGGVELNFEVVGGTTQPTNPKENTIWVNTPNEITGWGFGAEEDKPETPVTGMVWFVTTENSTIRFDALKEDSIIVTPAMAYQYISGAWEGVSVVKIYQSGEWVDWMPAGALYWRGNQRAEVTGGWNAAHTNSTSVTWGADYVEFNTFANVDNRCASIWTNNPVNIGDHSYLSVVIPSMTRVDQYGMFAVGVTTAPLTSNSYGTSHFLQGYVEKKEDFEQGCVIDVPLNGVQNTSVYVQIIMNAMSSAKISEILLVK